MQRPHQAISTESLSSEGSAAVEQLARRSRGSGGRFGPAMLWISASGPAGEIASPIRTRLRTGAIAILSGLLVLSALLWSPNQAVGLARDVTPRAVDLAWGVTWEALGPDGDVTPEAAGGEWAQAAPTSSPSRAADNPSVKFDQLPPWVEAIRTTSLWSSQRENPTAPSAIVPERSLLKVLGHVEQGLLPVYLDASSSDGKRLGGWVDPQDVKASDGPPRVVASSRGGNRQTPDISTPDKFIAAVAGAAQDSQRDSRVPPSVTIAQAILESDWGKSLLAKKGQNYFGIKATNGPGTAGVINMNTWEVLSGRNVVVNDGFRAYNTLYESVMDHGRFLADNSRYAAAFKVLDDARGFARRIQAAGYATDPSYSTKLINLMNRYNLFQYDLPLP